jgi:hypothetical protein
MAATATYFTYVHVPTTLYQGQSATFTVTGLADRSGTPAFFQNGSAYKLQYRETGIWPDLSSEETVTNTTTSQIVYSVSPLPPAAGTYRLRLQQDATSNLQNP